MRASALLICLAAWAAGAATEAAAAPTLCRPGETVVFSCPVGARIASICASAPITEGGGSLQYRFGTRDRLELAYPQAPARPGDVFTSGTMTFSGGGGAWLRFTNGAFQYTVFTATGRWGPGGRPAEVSGIAVRKDGRDVADLPCRAAPVSEIGPDLAARLGLRAADSEDEFEIPDAFFQQAHGLRPR